ncbi:MAG: hypothetical protein AAFQ75_05350 [Pseudomonadota bacterium]
MKTLRKTGVKFDERYFDGEILQAIAAGRLCPGRPQNPAVLLGVPVPEDPRMAFREAWRDLADSPRLAMRLGGPGQDRETLFAHAMRRQWQGAAGMDGACPPIRHEVVALDDGRLEHLIDGVPVLRLAAVWPAGPADRAAFSDRITFVVAHARLSVDALVLVAASGGVDVPVLVQARAETVRFVIQQYTGVIMLHAPLLIEGDETGAAAEARLLAVLGFVRRAMTPLWIAETLLAGLPAAARGPAAAELLFHLKLMAMPFSGRTAVLRRLAELPQASHGFIDALAVASAASEACCAPPPMAATA